MPLAERHDPYMSFHFLLEIENLIKGGFTKMSGLQVETEIEDFREGGENDFIHTLPTATKYQNVILERGVIDHALWDWHRKVRNGNIERKTVWVVILDQQGNEAVRWSFKQAWPIRWQGPELKADSNTVAVESIELVHQGIEKA